MGYLADAAFGDPRRGHPVAGFGRLAGLLERCCYADERVAGAGYTAVLVGGAVGLGVLAERAAGHRPVLVTGLTALATWAVLGGTSLARHGTALADELRAADDGAARARIPALCGRDPNLLDAAGMARAGTESLAENTSDAVVAPLFWGAVAGVPGLLGYRAVNTLDAMVGYRSARYARFGWAAARLDDVANLVPARAAALLFAVAAPAVGGSTGTALRAWRRDARQHPSPNAGPVEAAAAGALGVRLGGPTAYRHGTEERPRLGDGPAPTVRDLDRAVRLVRVVSAAAAALAVVTAAVLGRPRHRRVRCAGRCASVSAPRVAASPAGRSRPARTPRSLRT